MEPIRPATLRLRVMPHPRPGQFEPNKLWQEAREPIFWLDAELRLAWVNRSWETLTGHTAPRYWG